jgi:hypothetical protein
LPCAVIGRVGQCDADRDLQRNGISGRLGNLLAWLEEAAPDIVCLQELKASDDKFPAPALRAAGYGAVWHGQKSWNGVAILARGAERNAFARDAGLRIDHLLLSPSLAGRLVAAGVDRVVRAREGRAITRRSGSNLRTRPPGHRGSGSMVYLDRDDFCGVIGLARRGCFAGIASRFGS